MPRAQVYSVDFRHGNLDPTVDANGWGPMKLGDSGAAASPTSSGVPQGLDLSVTASGAEAAIGVYAVPAQGALALDTRLLMEVEFEHPEATAAGAAGSPEPWAVALNLKFGDESFVAGEPMVPVTCQFRPNGVRLNTPGHLEGDQAGMLVTPLDYPSLSPGRFMLGHHFCGANASRGYAIGYGTLTIGAPIRKDDQRVYSNSGLSNGQQTWIGTLGVTLVTVTGHGRIAVRPDAGEEARVRV